MTDMLSAHETPVDADFVEGADGLYFSADGAWWWDEDADNWALVEVIERESVLNREVPTFVAVLVFALAAVLAATAVWTGYRMHETSDQISCSTSTLNATLQHLALPDC